MDSPVNPAYSRVRARICQGHLSPLAPQQFLPSWSRRDPLADDANFGHAPRVSTYCTRMYVRGNETSLLYNAKPSLATMKGLKSAFPVATCHRLSLCSPSLCEGLLLLAIELEITGGRDKQRRGEVDQGEGDRDYRSDTMMKMMMSRTKILGRGATFPISLNRHILPRWACFNTLG